MKFGRFPLNDLEGAILAHSTALSNGTRLPKGHVLRAADLDQLKAAGHSTVMAAVLEGNDIAENDAAAVIGHHLTHQGLAAGQAANGRVNIYSTGGGLFKVNRARLAELNALDEGIGIATLPDGSACGADQLVATVKIIPFAVPQEAITNAESIIEAGLPFSLVPYAMQSATLIQTGTGPDKLTTKTARVTGARLARLGLTMENAGICDHEETALAAALKSAVDSGSELILIMGASATVDRGDVVPAAITMAGGAIERFGIPMDPGNLLLLGRIGETSIIGMPGCARSSQDNGFDRVLGHILAREEPSPDWLAGLGHGGLLKESANRPQPRESHTPPISAVTAAGIILAAGASRRMGSDNKLLVSVDGKPMAQHVIDLARTTKLAPLVLVGGHQQGDVTDALDLRGVTCLHNPDHDSGMASSIRVGIATLADSDCSHCFILLGDMPFVQPETLAAMLEGAAKSPEAIILPTCNGRRGNPVLFPASLFPALLALEGDTGARHLIMEMEDRVLEVKTEDNGVFADIDTLDALARHTDTNS